MASYDKSYFDMVIKIKQGSVAQSVTDSSVTANPMIASSILARSHTFVEIDHERISTVILLPSAESFKISCCQLQAKVCAQLHWLTACLSLPRKRCGQVN